MKNFGSPNKPAGPSWAKMYVGRIKGPEAKIVKGVSKNVYSGLYSVKLDTGQVRRNIPFMPSSYSPKTNSGMLRTYDVDEPVIVAETNKGETFILGNALLPFQNTTAPLPAVGGFNRPMKPGEVVIGGPSIKVPQRTSYMFFDSSGGIELKANTSVIKVNGEAGNIDITAFRYGLFTESGSETWGAHPLVGNSTPPGFPRPGKWRRLVRCKDSDNWGPFIYTEQGNLGVSAMELDANPTTPIHMQNFNNAASILVNRTGGVDIISGLTGPSVANSKQAAQVMQGLSLTAPLAFKLDPITSSATLRAPAVSIQGGLTGTEGAVSIRAQAVSTAASSSINLTSQGSVAIISSDVIIKASSTKLIGDVTIVGNLKVAGSINAGGISASSVNAPFMSIDKI